MTETNLVSAVISAYQSAGTLERAVESVLGQTYQDLEVVVVDNGSSDGTGEVIARLQEHDARVRGIRLEENQRPAGGRNAGAFKAAGKYLAFLDADDAWLPEKLEHQVWALDHAQDAGVVITDGWIIDERNGERQLYSSVYQGRLEHLQLNPLNENRKLYWLDGGLRRSVYEKNFLNLSSVMVRRELFIQTGGFDMRRFGPEDMDLLMRLARRTRFVYYSEPAVNRFINGENLSTPGEKWLLELLAYHQDCSMDEEYADLGNLIQKNLAKYYKLLLMYYGSRREVGKAWLKYRESFRYGFFPELTLYLALTPFGSSGYTAGAKVKEWIRKGSNQ